MESPEKRRGTTTPSRSQEPSISHSINYTLGDGFSAPAIATTSNAAQAMPQPVPTKETQELFSEMHDGQVREAALLAGSDTALTPSGSIAPTPPTHPLIVGGVGALGHQVCVSNAQNPSEQLSQQLWSLNPVPAPMTVEPANFVFSTVSSTGRPPETTVGAERSASPTCAPPSQPLETLGKHSHNGSGGNGGGRRNNNKRARHDDSGQSQKRFACPYFKHDPHRYRDRKPCCGAGWKDIHRVKDHLFRNHRQPGWGCQRCLSTFKTIEELYAHCQSKDACEVKEAEADDTRLNPRQEMYLRKKFTPGMTDTEKWEYLYKTLFPGGPVPASPYYDDDPNDLVLFGERIVKELPRLYRRELEQEMDRCQRSSEVDMRRMFWTIVSEALKVPEGILPAAPHAMLADDPDWDSGYASASRLGTFEKPSEPAAPEPAESLMASISGEDIYPCSDEVGSVESNDNDISSQASGDTTVEGLTGKALIRVFLAKETRFRSLCEQATARMGRQRFIENMRRLLKSYHINLTAEASTEAQKAVARLLKSRRGRLRISHQLATYFEQEEEDGRREALQVPTKNKRDIEEWLACVVEKPSEERRDIPTTEGDSKASASSSEDEDSDGEKFPNILETEALLRNAISYEMLLRDFMLMLLPTELRYVVSTIKKKDIWASQQQDFSVGNRIKGWMEDSTQVKWNWWPLEARKRRLIDGEFRLFWRCPCGSLRWDEISSEQYDVLRQVLSMLEEEPPQNSHPCRKRPKAGLLLNWLRSRFWRAAAEPAATGSSAAQRYTPSGVSVAPSPASGLSPCASGGQTITRPPVPPERRASYPVQHSPTTPPDPVPRNQLWILFGVQRARLTVVPTQIVVTDNSTDYSLFQDLRRCYRTQRGWLRLWFSIWRLEYCDVAKFHRLTPDRIVRDRPDLPTDPDYRYRPRAPGARNPPIPPHLFQALFYACPSPCAWPVLHDCFSAQMACDGVENLERIPKRAKSFDRDQTLTVWGLEPVFAVSFAYVLAYHFVMVAGPLVYFVWRAAGSGDGDLQNPSIPLAVVLGTLSLFWSGAGILTAKV